MESIIFLDSNFENGILISKKGGVSRQRICEFYSGLNGENIKVEFCGKEYEISLKEYLEQSGKKGLNEAEIVVFFINKIIFSTLFIRKYTRVGKSCSSIHTQSGQHEEIGGILPFGVGLVILSTPELFKLRYMINSILEGYRAEIAPLSSLGKISLHENTQKALKLLRATL